MNCCYIWGPFIDSAGKILIIIYFHKVDSRQQVVKPQAHYPLLYACNEIKHDKPTMNYSS